MIESIKALESNNILIRFDHKNTSHDQILKIANNLQSVFPNKKFLFISKNIDILEITDEGRKSSIRKYFQKKYQFY